MQILVIFICYSVSCCFVKKNLNLFHIAHIFVYVLNLWLFIFTTFILYFNEMFVVNVTVLKRNECVLDIM